MTFVLKFSKEEIKVLETKIQSKNSRGYLFWKSYMFQDRSKHALWYIELHQRNSILEFDLHLAHTEVFVDMKVDFTIKILDEDCALAEVSGKCLMNSKVNHQLLNQNLIHTIFFLLMSLRDKIKLSFDINVTLEENVDRTGIVIREMPDFEKLFDSGDSSDFVIVVDSGREFKVHKIILSTRSSVFEKMLTTNMKEKYDGKTEINDFSEKVVQELLRYIYCGKVEDLNTIVGDLLLVADKYMLNDLKKLCLHKMCEKLSVENAMNLLSKTYNSQDQELKSKIMYFIVSNLQLIANTKDYQDCDDPNILKDILSKTILKCNIVKKI